MKKKVLIGINIIISIICLLISLKLFWNMGLFIDEHNFTSDIILGNHFWVLMDWLRLGLLALMFVFSILLLFFDKKNGDSQLNS